MDGLFRNVSDKKCTQSVVNVHSHIKGLGLDKTLEPLYVSEGLVGQLDARKAAGVLVTMIKQRKLSGRSVLFSGPSSTGKTAIAMAIATSLGSDTPFTILSAGEICSLDKSKAEVLTQALRKSIFVRTKEMTEIIEGQVVEFEMSKPADGVGPKSGKLKLKTMKMENTYELGCKMIDALIIGKVTVGDVVSINKLTGKIMKTGVVYKHEKDRIVSYVECPDDELQKTREVVYNVSLHEIDCVNSGACGFLAMYSGDTGEINPDIRAQVDAKILEWVEEGKAELIPGVLFIEHAHQMNLECFTFLNCVLENDLAPTVLMSTNIRVAKVKGTDYTTSHGMPMDFLDRLLIIETDPYNESDLREILKIRCITEDVLINEAALRVLTKIASATSLAYAVQIIGFATFVVQQKNPPQQMITVEDLRRVYTLFWDTKRTANYLKRVKMHANLPPKSNADINVFLENPPAVNLITEQCDLEVPQRVLCTATTARSTQMRVNRKPK